MHKTFSAREQKLVEFQRLLLSNPFGFEINTLDMSGISFQDCHSLVNLHRQLIRAHDNAGRKISALLNCNDSFIAEIN